jgi:glycosyltransferase involved in cell wall biosynthesis
MSAFHPQPLVSVVMPCYNAVPFLRQAIESVLNQTYRHMEIILIDDGSTDATPDIIYHYARDDSRIRFFSNEVNRRLIYTLNRGVSIATGEFIMRADADDICDANRLEQQLNFMFRYPETDVCSAGCRYIDINGKVIHHMMPKTTLTKALYFQSFFSTPVNHAITLAKTEVMKNNPYDPDYLHSEDFELFSRLLAKGYKLRNVPMELYSIRINPHSVSNRFEQIQNETHTHISKRNLFNYFGTNYDFFIHKVMIHRIAFHPDVNMVVSALEELDRLKQIFFQRENCNADEKAEIESFLIEQKIDILIQAFKASKLFDKLRLIPILHQLRHLFRSIKGKTYLKSKFSKKKAHGFT